MNGYIWQNTAVGRAHRPAGPACLLALVLGLSACAADNPAPAAKAGPPPEASVLHGTILAMRPVQPGPETAGAGPGAAVLSSLAQSASSSETGAGASPGGHEGPATDFVVRETGGATIAVVQANTQHFRIGDQVEIVRSDRTRLSRPGV